MYRVFMVLFVVMVSGCSTISPPVTMEVANQLSEGRTAIAFYDSNKRINYLEDIYLVLAVAQTASSSSYNGVWDNSKEITKLHKEELAKLGLKTFSIYDVFSENEINSINILNNESANYSNIEKQRLSIELKNVFIEKKY